MLSTVVSHPSISIIQEEEGTCVCKTLMISHLHVADALQLGDFEPRPLKRVLCSIPALVGRRQLGLQGRRGRVALRDQVARLRRTA